MVVRRLQQARCNKGVKHEHRSRRFCGSDREARTLVPEPGLRVELQEQQHRLLLVALL